VVEGDVLGDQTAGRQAHEANLSEMVTQHLGVVRSQLFRVGWGGRTAPALDDVQRVLVRQSAEAMTVRARNQPARLLVVECHARQHDKWLAAFSDPDVGELVVQNSSINLHRDTPPPEVLSARRPGRGR
jgi:hypothetical protein